MKCMLCGRENPDDALYCGGCGWPQKAQKKSGGWKIAVVGILVVALIAGAVLFFCRPTQKEPYETIAEAFVETYWQNDMPTMETLVEYSLFSYLEDEIDTGSPVSCTAEARQSVPCDADRILDIEMALSFMGTYDTITEAYTVAVDYTADGRPGDTEVTVGKIGEDWVVVSFRPFYAE